MPFYDRLCITCHKQVIDSYEPVEAPNPPCSCGGEFVRAWLSKPPSVVGDACDVWVKNGICHSNGEPKHYTSKAEMKRAADEKGLVNRVRHVGRQGSDKSPHTTRWI